MDDERVDKRTALYLTRLKGYSDVRRKSVNEYRMYTVSPFLISFKCVCT